MTKQRLYHSNFNHNGYRTGKANKSRAHNLRASNALKNELDDICSPALIKDNVLFIDGKRVNALDGNDYLTAITKTLEKEKSDYIANLENAYTDTNKAELSGSRAKAKAALKRYAEGAEGPEETFWKEMTERLGKEKIDAESEIQKLKDTSSKIKRFNQKKSRLEELEKYNNLIDVKSRNTQYTVFSKEMVYKIPDNTNLDISAIDFANFANKMNKKLYPDFRSTYLVVHCDENVERKHVHTELSGLNLKTGKMDIQEQLFVNLQKQYELKNKDFELAGKNYNSLDSKEIKRFGELYQDFIFEEMNGYMLKKGYKIKLEKRTVFEKIEDTRKFVKNKSTQDREFTRKNKLKEINEKNQENIILQENDIDINNDHLHNQSLKINRNNKKINDQKEDIKNNYAELDNIKKLKLNVESAINYAVDFAKNPKIKTLMEYKKHFNEIRDETLSLKTKNTSKKIQPTYEQEQEIERSSSRNRRRMR